MDQPEEFTFKQVQLFKNKTLGTGSYGAVCKAKCDQLICAAKLLYPVLFQMQVPDPGKEHRQPFRRFEVECRFLKSINHPNIVQYLGTYRDPETNAPVLLMELMDESLTHFLESSPGDIPYHIQVNLSQDIAQALAFLHANGIIHRDLSSNNVLLIAGSRAKVSDFGMLRFVDTVNLATMTTCPGTAAYMPPEALNEPPVYSEKLDTFSVGVLLIQMMTRQYPEPSDRFRSIQIPDPQNPITTLQVLVPIPDVERRQAHISLIEPTHPLLPIALECLKHRDVERPSSQELCQMFEELKNPFENDGRGEQLQMFDQQTHEQIRARGEQLQEYRSDLISKENEIRELKSKLNHLQEEHQAKNKDVQLKANLCTSGQENEDESQEYGIEINRLKAKLEEMKLKKQTEVQAKDLQIQNLLEKLRVQEDQIFVEAKQSDNQDTARFRQAYEKQNKGEDEYISRQVQTETVQARETEFLQQSADKAQRESLAKDTEIQQLRVRLDEALRESRREIEAKETELRQLGAILEQEVQVRDLELRRLNQQQRSNQEVIAELQETISRLETRISELMARRLSENEPRPSKLTINGMMWTTQPDSIIGIFAGSCAQIEHTVYFKPRNRPTVYEYNSTDTASLWRELPPHRLTDYTIAAVDCVLTTVGGCLENWLGNDKCSNQLYSYKNGKWEKYLPPMLTKREAPGVVSTSSTLVVAGGSNDGVHINTVETMSIRQKSWSIVSSLPFSTFQPSMTIRSDCVYLHPRYMAYGEDKHRCSVIKCSLGDLVNSKPRSTRWKTICSLPVCCSGLVTFSGHLLAVGGKKNTSDSEESEIKEVYEYNHITDSWEVVSEMIEARHYCLTALLPDNKLLVAGGATSDQTMEIATFV